MYPNSSPHLAPQNHQNSSPKKRKNKNNCRIYIKPTYITINTIYTYIYNIIAHIILIIKKRK